MTIDEAIRIIKIVLVVTEDFEITLQGEEFTKEKCKEAVEIVTEALSSSEKPNKWILVSERLPEEEGLYLVYTKEQPYVCPFDGREWHIDEVIAWMPLPEPYVPDTNVGEMGGEQE